jgi:shikimate kinase
LDRLVERTRRDRKRPLLRHGNSREIQARLQREREPLNREVADYRFVTERQAPRVLARDIEDRLREDGVI